MISENIINKFKSLRNKGYEDMRRLRDMNVSENNFIAGANHAWSLSESLRNEKVPDLNNKKFNIDNSSIIENLKQELKQTTDCDSSWHSGVNDGMYTLLKYLMENNYIVNTKDTQ